MDWFTSYLSKRKQFIGYLVNSKSTLLLCGVLEGFIFAPLLFLLYINNLPQASKLFDRIMFADDTDLFDSGKISTRFLALQKINCQILVTGSMMTSYI